VGNYSLAASTVLGVENFAAAIEMPGKASPSGYILAKGGKFTG